MELDTFGTRSAQLLAEQELQSVPHIPEPLIEIKVEQSRGSEEAVTCLSILVLSLPLALLLYIFVQEWAQETYYRAWLLLACVPPLSYAVQHVWARARLTWQHWKTIQVVIDSMRAATLFNAVVDCVEQEAEQRNET